MWRTECHIQNYSICRKHPLLLPALLKACFPSKWSTEAIGSILHRLRDIWLHFENSPQRFHQLSLLMHFLHQVSPISHRDEGPLISEPRSSISHVSSLTHLGFWALTPARSVIYKKCSSLGFCFCFFLVVEVNVSLRRYQAKQMLKAAEQKSRGQHTVTVWFRKNLTSLCIREKQKTEKN